MLIYILGVVICYYLIKLSMWVATKDIERDWDDIGKACLVSIFSWIAIASIIILIVIALGDFLLSKIKLRLKNKKAPKWL